MDKYLVQGKDILLCFDLGSSKAATEVKKQVAKYEKLRSEETEVHTGSFLLLPTQQSMEKRMGLAGSKKRKKMSALCNVIGKETLHFCVFGSLDARPLLYLATPTGTDTGVFNKYSFSCSWFRIYASVRTRADSTCDWWPVPLPCPEKGVGPFVAKSLKAEA